MTATVAQRAAALDRANEVRVHRSRFRLQVRGRNATDLNKVCRLILGPPWWARGWRLTHLLKHTPGVGTVAAARILRCLGAPGNTNLGDLDQRDREHLAYLVRRHAAVHGKQAA